MIKKTIAIIVLLVVIINFLLFTFTKISSTTFLIVLGICAGITFVFFRKQK